MKRLTLIGLLGVVSVGCSNSNLTAANSKPVKTTTTVTTPIDKPVEPDPTTLPPDAPNAKLALLIDKMDCVFCHLEIHGDVGSVGDMSPLRNDSVGQIAGRWLISGLADSTTNLVQVSGGVVANFDNADKSLPVDSSGKPAFPMIDFAAVGAKVAGTLKASTLSTTITGVAKDQNIVVLGTADKPIEIAGDIYVKGDVIIKGVYKGRGTIYASGNIYVPANLKAKNYPTIAYSTDRATALAQGKTAANDAGLDALALASAKSIFIADLENYADNVAFLPSDLASGSTTVGTGIGNQAKFTSIYDHQTPLVPAQFQRDVTGISGVYTWYNGGEAGYQSLYESVTPCASPSNRTMVHGASDYGARSFDRIDAFLYAKVMVGGISRGSSYVLNGGVIAAGLHLVGGVGLDTANCPKSVLNFDYRFAAGMPVLQALAPFFN